MCTCMHMHMGMQASFQHPSFGPDNLDEARRASDPQTGVVKSFESMRLKDELLRGVYSYGFERPSAQDKASGNLIHPAESILADSSPKLGSAELRLKTCH